MGELDRNFVLTFRLLAYELWIKLKNLTFSHCPANMSDRNLYFMKTHEVVVLFINQFHYDFHILCDILALYLYGFFLCFYIIIYVL